MLVAGPLYAAYGGRAYWAMAARWPLAALLPPCAGAHARGTRLSPRAAARAGAPARPRSAAPGSRSRASSSGPSRSTQSASCASSTAGAMASEVATMQPTMILKPRARASRGQRQRLGEAAGLVELDVDGVVAAGEAGRGRRACAGIRRRRPAPGAALPASAASAPAGSGCSISSKPVSAATRISSGSMRRRPGLVGVGDQARVRAGGAHLAQALGIAVRRRA